MERIVGGAWGTTRRTLNNSMLAPRRKGSRLREQELLRSQLLDGIPELRRFFELEALRRLAHVTFQFPDVSVDFFLRLELWHALGLASGQVGIIRSNDGRQRHVQWADDRLRRD